ncbi:plasmodesmata-located protein 2-like isoform X2 [Rhodamnia argentea]|uniref:Plasmodesmata-located protein 2-like isoform X2 n=1 Tax=Rhodamnia argentea TaxID=178133 RepID=A0A8B8N0X8_9MYRT|nr:plasmodesmata-located protein 2-like isoform X2 [Rhodamnia argentea]
MGLLLSRINIRVFFFALLLSLSPTEPSSDFTGLVFKGCAQQKLPDPTDASAQNLQSLLSTLTSQASQKTFYSTTVGDGTTAVSGLFQCRGDLTAAQCGDCIGKTPDLARKLCGGAVAAARVQLKGCYLKYQISGFVEAPDTDVVYKVCGSEKDAGFGAKRETAFGMVESGVVDGGGFYTGSYGNVYVLGQCEGDAVIGGDCEGCVKNALERVEAECGEAISGQVYMNKCYVSFSYYPNGVAGVSPPSASLSGTGEGGTGGGRHTQKTVAVVVGGAAAVGFGVVCLLFAKSLFKKRDASKYDS